MKYLLILLASVSVQAQEVPLKPWILESELSLVSIAGNSESESYSFRQKLAYKIDKNLVALNGRYLNTRSLDATTQVVSDTARLWDISLRYDREIREDWSAYFAVGAEANPFAGYVQKDNAELGGKYVIVKDAWYGEFGYRNTRTYDTTGNRFTTHYGRLFTEYVHAFTATTSAKMAVEYLPNFTTPAAFVVNAEPSMTVILSSVLSLKMAYSLKHNAGNEPPLKKTDTQLTSALVAKF